MAAYTVQYLDGEKETNTYVSRSGRVLVRYDTGDTFDGTLDSRGLRYGKGTYTWASPAEDDAPSDGSEAKVPSATYTGTYVDGKRVLGLLRYSNADTYQGQFGGENQMFEGFGTYTFAKTGDVFSGRWSNGVRHGKGTYVYKSSGTQLIGEWQNGALVTGKLKFADGSLYYGGLEQQVVPSGEGLYLRNDFFLEVRHTVESKEDAEDELPSCRIETLSVRSAQRGVSSKLLTASGVGSGPSPPSFVLNPSPPAPLAQEPSEEVLMRSDQLSKAIAAVDAEGSGRIAFEELAEYIRNNADVVPLWSDLASDLLSLQDILKELDADGDGKIETHEVEEFYYVHFMFKATDVNGNGSVSIRELQHYLQANIVNFPHSITLGGLRVGGFAEAATALTQSDEDQDGGLSIVEFWRFYKSLKSTEEKEAKE